MKEPEKEFRSRRRGSALVREAEAAHRDAELLPHVVHQLLVVHAGAFPSPRLGLGGSSRRPSCRISGRNRGKAPLGGGEDIARHVHRLAHVVHIARGVIRHGAFQLRLRHEEERVRRRLSRLAGDPPQGDLLEERLQLHLLLEVEHEERLSAPASSPSRNTFAAELEVADTVIAHRDGDLALPRMDDEQPVAARLVGEVELRHTLGTYTSVSSSEHPARKTDATSVKRPKNKDSLLIMTLF